MKELNKTTFTNIILDNLNNSISENGKVDIDHFIKLTNSTYEAINKTSSCAKLKDDFEIGEQVLLTTRTLVTIDTFCEDGMIGIDDNNEYYKVGKDELTKRV